jgi:hypothetical protein
MAGPSQDKPVLLGGILKPLDETQIVIRKVVTVMQIMPKNKY